MATDIPKLRGLNDFICHCCVEAKMNHGPQPPRSLRVITVPGELVSFDVTGPIRTASIHGNKYGLIFIDHFTNTPFNYAMKSKDGFPKLLQQFLIYFKKLFKGWKVIEIQVLRSAMQVNSTLQKYSRSIEIRASNVSFQVLGNNFKMEKQRNVSVTCG